MSVLIAHRSLSRPNPGTHQMCVLQPPTKHLPEGTTMFFCIASSSHFSCLCLMSNTSTCLHFGPFIKASAEQTERELMKPGMALQIILQKPIAHI